VRALDLRTTHLVLVRTRCFAPGAVFPDTTPINDTDRHGRRPEAPGDLRQEGLRPAYCVYVTPVLIAFCSGLCLVRAVSTTLSALDGAGVLVGDYIIATNGNYTLEQPDPFHRRCSTAEVLKWRRACGATWWLFNNCRGSEADLCEAADGLPATGFR